MQSHEVLKAVLKETGAKQIAADLGLSLSLIYKWTEPSSAEVGSGSSNPLDRIGQLLKSTGDRRVAQWVCEQAGGFFTPNPKSMPQDSSLIPFANSIVREFADMLGVITQATEDGQITHEEAIQIRRRWEALKSVTEGFVHACEQGNFRGLKKDLVTHSPV